MKVCSNSLVMSKYWGSKFYLVSATKGKPKFYILRWRVLWHSSGTVYTTRHSVSGASFKSLRKKLLRRGVSPIAVPYEIPKKSQFVGFIKQTERWRRTEFRTVSQIMNLYMTSTYYSLPEDVREWWDNIKFSLMVTPSVTSARRQIEDHLNVGSDKINKKDFEYLLGYTEELGIPKISAIKKKDLVGVMIDPSKSTGPMTRIRYLSSSTGSFVKQPLVMVSKGAAVDLNLAYSYEILRQINIGNEITPSVFYLIQGREKDNVFEQNVEFPKELKTRLVLIPDECWDIFGRCYLQKVKRRWNKENSPIHPKKSTLGKQMEMVHHNTENTINGEGDWKSFDATAKGSIISLAFDIAFQNVVCRNKRQKYLLKCIEFGFIHKYVIADCGMIVRMDGSIPSGHSLTSFIGSIVNWIYLKHMILKCPHIRGNLEERERSEIWTQGDDWVIKFPKSLIIEWDSCKVWLETTFGIKFKFKFEQKYPNVEDNNAFSFLRVIKVNDKLSVKLSDVYDRMAGSRHKPQEAAVSKYVYREYKGYYNPILDNPPAPGTLAFEHAVNYLIFTEKLEKELSKRKSNLFDFDRGRSLKGDSSIYSLRWLTPASQDEITTYKRLLKDKYINRLPVKYEFSSEKVRVGTLSDKNRVRRFGRAIRSGRLGCTPWV